MLSEEMGLEGMKSIDSEDLEEEGVDESLEMRGSLSISWSAILSKRFRVSKGDAQGRLEFQSQLVAKLKY